MTTHAELVERLTPRLAYEDPGIYLDIPAGWVGLIDSLDRSIAKQHPGYKILQVKEKFGGLRFYVWQEDDSDALMEPLIRAAEQTSLTICQKCGELGKLRLIESRLYATLCDEHTPEDSVKL